MTGMIQLEAIEYAVFERELYANVTLTRTGDLSAPAEVTYTTVPGSATAGEDFVATTGTVTFGTRVGNVTVSIGILDDRDNEPKESFTLSLTAVDPGSTLMTPHTATISIRDDETDTSDPEREMLTPLYEVRATEVLTGLRNPVSLEFLPGTTKALIVEKSGLIKLADLGVAGGKATNLLDLRAQVNAKGDRGLVDVALHPDLATHPYLYAYYVVDPPDAAEGKDGAARDADGNRFCHLSRFLINLDGPTPKIDMESETVILGGGARTLSDVGGGGILNYGKDDYIANPASNLNADGSYKRDFIKDDSVSHYGGGLAFGPDGMLYVATGDGSAFEFPDPRAANVQDIDSLNGKVLRIDPLTGSGLPDNPFANDDLGSNRSKVWAMGLRNPYTLAFAPDGRLFAGEVGWNAWEEIALVSAGANYGWPFYEGGDNGTLVQTTGYKKLPAADAFYEKVQSGALVITPPYRAFSHSTDDPGYHVQAIVGASGFYSGDAYPPELANAFFFSDIVDGEIYAADINDPAKVQYITDIGTYGPASLIPGPDGMLLADMQNGRILKLTIGARRETDEP
jgi:glucose/arabinose dehydrogenase